MDRSQRALARSIERAGHDRLYSAGCTGGDTCFQGLVLGERIRTLHDEVASVQRRLDRLESVLGRGMAVLLANLTGMVLMLAKQFLLS